MVRPVRSCNDEFDRPAKEFKWLEVFQLSVNEPLLQRPRNEDYGNHGQVVNGPLTDIDAKAHRHCPRDYQQPRDEMAEVASGSLHQRNLWAEPRLLVGAWSCILNGMGVGSEVEEQSNRETCDYPNQHPAVSILPTRIEFKRVVEEMFVEIRQVREAFALPGRLKSGTQSVRGPYCTDLARLSTSNDELVR